MKIKIPFKNFRFHQKIESRFFGIKHIAKDEHQQ